MYSTGVDARLPEPAVDARDEELDLVPLRAVLRALEPRRDEHLDHRRRARATRILLEEALERLELLRNALRVVEPLDAEHEPAPLVLLLEIGEEPRRLGVGERPRGSRSTSIPIGSTPMPTRRPSISSQSGSESIPRIRRHDERKWRA